MLWVTRDHVHVDRVVSPWLIKRFIDTDAEFKFVPWPGTTLSPSDGIPFDFPDLDIPFTHHDGKCTFEVLKDHHKLDDPVLDDMAEIIHGADVSKDIDKVPESRGVELVSSGLAYLSEDDHLALERGFILFDSMYIGLLLRRIREEKREELKGLGRQERFKALLEEVKKRTPPSIHIGPD